MQAQEAMGKFGKVRAWTVEAYRHPRILGDRFHPGQLEFRGNFSDRGGHVNAGRPACQTWGNGDRQSPHNCDYDHEFSDSKPPLPHPCILLPGAATNVSVLLPEPTLCEDFLAYLEALDSRRDSIVGHHLMTNEHLPGQFGVKLAPELVCPCAFLRRAKKYLRNVKHYLS